MNLRSYILLTCAAFALAAGARLSAQEIVPNRTAPEFTPAPAVPVAKFSAEPTDAEISAVRVFEDLLVPMSGASTPAENRALADALAAYQKARLAAGPSDAMNVDVTAFEKFLRDYPHSVWRVSLLTNLGTEYYRRAAFSKALAAWQAAWKAGRDEKSPAGREVVDRALGELAKMDARLGRVPELQALVSEAGERKVRGLGAEAYQGARGGLWNMQHKPEDSFKCGPWALDSILSAKNPAHPYRNKLREFASTDHGVSLDAVAALAGEMKMDLVPARRVGTGGSIPTPAVVHWKLGHYGALLRSENGRYLLQDPTFGNSQWISQSTLDAEASGNFLVPARALKDSKTWQPLSTAEAKRVWGKGFPTGYPPPDFPSTAQGLQDVTLLYGLAGGAPNLPPTEDTDFGSGLGNAAAGDASGVPPLPDPPQQPPPPDWGPSPPGDNIFNDPGLGTPSEPPFNPPTENPFNPPPPPDPLDDLLQQMQQQTQQQMDQLMQQQMDQFMQQQMQQTQPGAPSTYGSAATGGAGMAVWGINMSEVDLRLRDVPLFYNPPVGPRIHFQISYEQREANQPATLSFSNLGNKWNFNFVTTLTFDSNNAYVNYGESGLDTFASFTANTQSSGVSTITHTRLVRAGANLFQLVSADGSMRVFSTYDGSGRYYMTKMVDPHGNTVSLAYDNQYRLITITDALGQISVLSYTLAADPLKITKITDPFARTALFAYNAGNQLIQITDAQGMTSQFSYGTGDFVNTLTTGYGTTTFASTESGLDRTLVITLPDGSQEMAQSLGGSTPGVAFSDPTGKVPQGIPVDNGYLSARNTSFWDRQAMKEAPGDPTRARIYHYLHANNLQKGPILESIKLPLENRIWFYYQGQQQPGFINTDGQGMLDTPTLIGRVLDDGSTQLFQASYNALGHLTQTIDPVGRTRKYIYDSNNMDLLGVQQATGLNSQDSLGQATFNTKHQPLVLTDAAGQQTRITYNPKGQPLTLTDGKGQVTSYVYDANGYRQSSSGPAAGRTSQITYTYDAYGRVRTATDALGYTLTYAYDKLNRVTSVTYPDGTTTQYTYTLLDVTRYTDRLNRQTNYTYDFLREQTSRTDPLNRVTRYEYSLGGGLGAYIDPLGQTTRFDRDVQSRLTAKRFPDGSKTSYFYEATTSRLKSRLDAKGQTTSYQYNNDNTLKLISYSNALQPTPSVRFTYDDFYPRISSMIDGTGATNYSYQAPGVLGAGRLASVQRPFGTITFGYDELGRTTTRAVDGTAETRAFNLLGAVTSESNALGSFSYAYVNNTRQIAGVTDPNGQSTTFSYLPNAGDRRLASILHQRPGGAALSQWSYTYDPQGRILTWSQQRDANPARVYTFGYDAADQLTSASLTNPAATFGYTYDAAGNRLTETINGVTNTATYNSLSELANLSIPAISDRTCQWDAEQRLVAINYAGTTNRSEFTYDGFGHCVQIVEKTGGTVTSIRRFLWNGRSILEERDGTGQITKRFFRQGVKLITGRSAGNYYYTRDHLGSIRELTDGTGAIRARYDYDPFGRRTKLSGDLDTDFGFAGHYLHVPSGWSLARFRLYDPNLGRWLSRSRLLVNPQSYSYANNQPVRFVAP